MDEPFPRSEKHQGSQAGSQVRAHYIQKRRH